jgi:steroid 5-alpha reductase family enzyme
MNLCEKIRSSFTHFRMALPKSRSHWIDPFLILAVMIGVYWPLSTSSLVNTQIAMIIGVVLTVLMCLLEFSRIPWSKIPQPSVPLGTVFSRVSIKWLGTMLGVGFVLFCWWGLSEYKRGYFAPLFYALPYMLPAVPIVTFLCIFFTEWRLGPVEQHEGTQFGRFLLGQWSKIDWLIFRKEILSWLIKGFFLPLNFVELVHSINRIRGKELSALDMPFPQMEAFIATMIYTAIIASILPGYAFSARLFNTQVKKVDHSWFGWMVTLGCYAPLYAGVSMWFDYRENMQGMKPWAAVSQGNEWLMYALGGVILLCELTHYWGEAQMGVRSSNLTNRGIITVGPYRFCKHPVYVSKCIAWTLLWMPFLAGVTPLECVRLTLLMFCMFAVFLMRGWVEERLLSDDPDYVSYALWIDKHGAFAFMGRLIPPLSFAWRLEKWEEKRAKGYSI